MPFIQKLFLFHDRICCFARRLEALGSPRDGIIDVCEQPDLGAGNWTVLSSRTVCDLNHCHISPARDANIVIIAVSPLEMTINCMDYTGSLWDFVTIVNMEILILVIWWRWFPKMFPLIQCGQHRPFLVVLLGVVMHTWYQFICRVSDLQEHFHMWTSQSYLQYSKQTGKKLLTVLLLKLNKWTYLHFQ